MTAERIDRTMGMVRNGLIVVFTKGELADLPEHQHGVSGALRDAFKGVHPSVRVEELRPLDLIMVRSANGSLSRHVGLVLESFRVASTVGVGA